MSDAAVYAFWTGSHQITIDRIFAAAGRSESPHAAMPIAVAVNSTRAPMARA